WRDGVQRRRILAQGAVEEAAIVAGVGETVGLAHQVEVVDACVTDRALVQPGIADRIHQRRISTEAGTEYADPPGIGHLVVDRPAHAVGDVVLDLAAPLAPAGLHRALAAPAGPAIVHLQHRVTAAGQELRFTVEDPSVVGSERAAV